MHEHKNYWRENCTNQILLERKSGTIGGIKITATASIRRIPPWYYPWIGETQEDALRLADGRWIRVDNTEIMKYSKLYADLEKKYGQDVYAQRLLDSAEG